MNLRPEAREFYILQITTSPQLTAWEASFDGEATWVAGAAVPATTDQFRWLVRGPTFNATGWAVATSSPIPAGRTVPVIRAADNPEVIYRKASAITVKT